MKNFSYYSIAALTLALLSQTTLAGDADITLKAPQLTQYSSAITIKPKGIAPTNQPVRKIEPEEIDKK